MTEYYLGIDGGGTKSEFLLCDREGRQVNRALLGGCNPNDNGIDAALKVLCAGAEGVCAGVSRERISVFAGVSGGITGNNREFIATALRNMGFGRVDCGSDAQNAVALTLGGGDGVTVIAGTGSVAFAQREGALYRLGGLGYLLERSGSGFALGRDALRAALTYEMEGAPSTLLLQAVKDKLGGGAVLDRLGEIYRGGKRYIASFAPLVTEACDGGDGVAMGILDDCAHEIASLIVGGGRMLEGTATPIRVAIVGGLAKRGDLLVPMIECHLTEPEKFTLTAVAAPPVAGAVALAGLDKEIIQ